MYVMIHTPFKDHPQSFRKKFLPYALYALLPIALVRLCFFPLPSITSDHHGYPPRKNPILVSQSPPPPKVNIKEERKNNGWCDYSKGKWVQDPKGPLYNSTACGTIKDGQNCERHGRPDKSYLYWRWQPHKCQLPRFDPTQFLHLISHRHVAFVGDSIARNQLESLLCLLATAAGAPPTLVHTSGPDHRFGKWRFGSHNATLSVYWSPFLVKGVEKSERDPYNRLDLDSVSDVWAKDLRRIDVVILSVGHWFLHPAVFHRRGAAVGCHYCGGNHTEVGFYDAYATAINTTLRAIADRRRQGLDVVVTTFSPAHFEGEWDSPGACSKTRPEERDLEGMDYEMWRRVVEEVAAAGGGLRGFRVAALDVSRLAVVRPDGHPGPYMNPFPFANGVGERVQNDCVHWCLPGPIDTWNEIMLQIMKRWNG